MPDGLVPFLVAATALLGTPGPGIAALVAVGRTFDTAAAFRFYLALQCGLALAAAASALGLAAVLAASSTMQTALMAAATLYLLWLAWTVASAPTGTAIGEGDSGALTVKGAFFLGIANPKAYLAFASLFGSFALLPPSSAGGDSLLKWALCVLVMVIVDLAWLALGMIFGRIALAPTAERAFNVGMGLAILGACLMSWQ